MSEETPIKLIELAIRERHVLRLVYRPLRGGSEVLAGEPFGIRHSHAGHRVLWIWDVDSAGWKELLLDRIDQASDTGEVFEPRADWPSVAGP